MKKYLLVLLPAFALLFTGCKKDLPDFSGYLASGTSKSDSYLPLTKGTSWTYVTAIGPLLDTVVLLMTGESKTIDGRDFKALTSNNGSVVQTGYYSNQDHIYSLLQEVQGNIIEMVVLNDTASVGTTWVRPINSSGYVNGIAGRLKITTVEKNISKTVLGKTYNNVMHTQMIIQYNYGIGFQDSGTYEQYVAKGIGLVETNSDLFGLVTSTRLLNYSVK